MSQFSFSSSARPFMIIELVLVIPRSTGLDSKLGATGRPAKAGRRPPKSVPEGPVNQSGPRPLQ